MSSVRMCDKCGSIFKEGEEGSGTGSMTVSKRTPDGRVIPVQQCVDWCAMCTSMDVTPAAIPARFTDIDGEDKS
jgi:hypothetical protein